MAELVGLKGNRLVDQKSSIYESTKVDHNYYSPKFELYDKGKMIATIIIDCYYNLDFVKESIDSILKQDYVNVEMILIEMFRQTAG